jgi:hypothetical protein
MATKPGIKRYKHGQRDAQEGRDGEDERQRLRADLVHLLEQTGLLPFFAVRKDNDGLDDRLPEQVVQAREVLKERDERSADMTEKVFH